VQVKLLDREQDGVTYIRLKDDDEEGDNGIEFGIRVDERLMNGKDSFASVNQAVSLTNNTGFLTVIGSIPKTINGASMGLAVAIECCRPGKYDNAFTGFVSNMNENDLTCRVHDIDNVTIKIKGCAKQKVPLVVPFSAEVGKLRRIVISPKDVCRGDIDASLSTYSAYTMLEAICIANVITSRNVSDAKGRHEAFDSNAAQRHVNRGRALEIARRNIPSNGVPTRVPSRSNTPELPEDQPHRAGAVERHYNRMFRDERQRNETLIQNPSSRPHPALMGPTLAEQLVVRNMDLWSRAQLVPSSQQRELMIDCAFASILNYLDEIDQGEADRFREVIHGTDKNGVEQLLKEAYNRRYPGIYATGNFAKGEAMRNEHRRSVLLAARQRLNSPAEKEEVHHRNRIAAHRAKEYMQTMRIKKYAENPDPSVLGQQVVRPDEYYPHCLNKQQQIVRQMMLENMQAAGGAEVRKRNRE